MPILRTAAPAATTPAATHDALATPRESDILWEGWHYWVLRERNPRQPRTQLMRYGACASTAVETYPAGADGESIAIVRARYLDRRAIASQYAKPPHAT